MVLKILVWNSRGFTQEKANWIIAPEQYEAIMIQEFYIPKQPKHSTIPILPMFNLEQKGHSGLYFNKFTEVRHQFVQHQQAEFFIINIEKLTVLLIYNTPNKGLNAYDLMACIELYKPAIFLGDLNVKMPNPNNPVSEKEGNFFAKLAADSGYNYVVTDSAFTANSGKTFTLDYVFYRGKVPKVKLLTKHQDSDQSPMEISISLDKDKTLRILKPIALNQAQISRLEKLKMKALTYSIDYFLRLQIPSQDRYLNYSIDSWKNFRCMYQDKSNPVSPQIWSLDLKATICRDPKLDSTWFNSLKLFFSQSPGFYIRALEVQSAIQKLSSKFTDPGPDGITIILYKPFSMFLATEFNEELRAGCLKNNKALIIPIYKNGDRMEPSNYRKITLENCRLKILSEVIRQRLISFGIENYYGPNQQFFIKGKFAEPLSKLVKNRLQAEPDLIYTFYNFKQAFDSVNRAKLIQKYLGLNSALVNACTYVKACLWQKKIKVINKTRYMKTSTGVEQGDPSCSMDFNFYIGDIFSKVSGEIYACADDIVIISDSPQAAKISQQEMINYALEKGLTLNIGETKTTNITANSNFLSSPADIPKTDPYMYHETQLELDSKGTVDRLTNIDDTCLIFKSQVEKFKASQYQYKRNKTWKKFNQLLSSIVKSSLYGLCASKEHLTQEYSFTKGPFLKIERIWLNFIKTVYKLPINCPVNTVYMATGLPPIRYFIFQNTANMRSRSKSDNYTDIPNEFLTYQTSKRFYKGNLSVDMAIRKLRGLIKDVEPLDHDFNSRCPICNGPEYSPHYFCRRTTPDDDENDEKVRKIYVRRRWLKAKNKSLKTENEFNDPEVLPEVLEYIDNPDSSNLLVIKAQTQTLRDFNYAYSKEFEPTAPCKIRQLNISSTDSIRINLDHQKDLELCENPILVPKAKRKKRNNKKACEKFIDEEFGIQMSQPRKEVIRYEDGSLNVLEMIKAIESKNLGLY